MLELTQESKDLIQGWVDSYGAWLKTPEGKESVEEHTEHRRFLSDKLSRENIDKIDEPGFRAVYAGLWASNIWSNKEWYIENKILKFNSLQKIKEELKALIYGESEISIRFDNFKENIKGIGASSITEILNFIFPEKYCLWNEKPKTVLPYLKINQLPERLFKYSLTNGTDYALCIEVLSLIKEELSKQGFTNATFIDVDCVLWHIYNKEVTEEQIEKVDANKIVQLEERNSDIHITSHEEAEYYLLKLGELLGYLPYTVDYSKTYKGKKLGEYARLQDIPDFAGQRDKNSAREIDVLWFDESENPKYCLEVEYTTDITKGLNRLLQLEHFNVTFIIVSSEDKRTKFETEMGKSPYRKLRDRYKFISYGELIKFYETTSKFRKIKDQLLE